MESFMQEAAPRGGGLKRAVAGMVAGAQEARAQRAAQEADRQSRLPMASREAASKLRVAEMDLDDAQDNLGRVAAAVLLGEAGEDDLRAAQRALRQARDDVEGWERARMYLDEARGVIRDVSGNLISNRHA